MFAGLTGSYGGNYNAPNGFCWDAISCTDEPIQDDPRLNGHNVKDRVDDFVRRALWQGNRTRGQHILMTMGADFTYEDAESWYRNLDKLIRSERLVCSRRQDVPGCVLGCFSGQAFSWGSVQPTEDACLVRSLGDCWGLVGLVGRGSQGCLEIVGACWRLLEVAVEGVGASTGWVSPPVAGTPHPGRLDLQLRADLPPCPGSQGWWKESFTTFSLCVGRPSVAEWVDPCG